LHRRHGGNVAEIGHFTVDSTYNLKCGCGHLGHWEGYASGRYIPQFFARWCELNDCSLTSHNLPRSEDIFRLAESSDPNVLHFIDELGRINGRGISNVIVAYDPEILILDGSVVLNNEPYVVSPMLKFIDRFLPLPKITTSHLKGLAPLLGASIIAKGYETSLGQVKIG
jgi:glucokinase